MFSALRDSRRIFTITEVFFLEKRLYPRCRRRAGDADARGGGAGRSAFKETGHGGHPLRCRLRQPLQLGDGMELLRRRLVHPQRFVRAGRGAGDGDDPQSAARQRLQGGQRQGHSRHHQGAVTSGQHGRGAQARPGLRRQPVSRRLGAGARHHAQRAGHVLGRGGGDRARLRPDGTRDLLRLGHGQSGRRNARRG